MEERTFVVRSDYDHKTLTVMARALRKTQRRVLSTVIRVFGWTAVVLDAALNLLMIAFGMFTWDFGEVVLLLALAVLLGISLFEDQLNAKIAAWQMLPGIKEGETRFTEAEYTVTTPAISTTYHYENIRTVCETAEYFVFFLSRRHGQIYPKSGFVEGSPETFRDWISQRTGKTVVYVR